MEQTIEQKIDNLCKIMDEHIKSHEEATKKVDEMYEIFITGKGGFLIVKWFFGFIMGIGAIILMIKGVLGK